MKKSLLFTPILIAHLFGSNVICSQEVDAFTHEAMAEKVYLQLDNEIYENDETIWFKAILVNAATHKSDRTSGVLQVDLVDASGDISVSRLVKIDNGIGHGQIALSSKFNPGIYLLRASTNWNRNFASDFGFEKYIQIFSSAEIKRPPQPLYNLKRFEVADQKQAISLEIYPYLIDNLHQGKLRAVINHSSQTDTLLVREKGGTYPLIYTLDNDIENVDLEFVTKNGLSYTQSIALKPDYTSLRFFPEGGKMVNGFDSKVGFKAVGADGKGKMVFGEIRNRSGKVITTFSSDSIGMGHFILPKVDSKESYLAVVDGGTYASLKINLPKVHSSGSVIMVEEDGKMINLQIGSNVLQNGNVVIEGLCRGYKYLKEMSRLNSGLLRLAVPKTKFPEGPIVFTLFTEDGKPLAERVFFNERLDRRLEIEVSSVKGLLDLREKHKLDIKVTKEAAIPSKTNMSVLVVNKDELDGLRKTRNTILSYLLLSSELKGTVERPGVYFTNNPNYNIDDLMLTQGWRNYNYVSPVKSTDFEMEKNLKAEGVINTKRTKKEKEQVDLSLLAFDKERSIYNTQVEAPGHFSMDLEDTYGNEMELAFQVSGKYKAKDYTVALKKRKKLPVKFNYSKLTLAKDSITEAIVEKRKILKEEENTYLNLKGVTLLDEVLLEGYVMTPKRKEISERFGMPDVVIEGNEIEEKEQKWSYGLFNVLESFFQDKIWVRTLPNGQIMVKSIRELGRGGAPTLIVVDGIPVREFEMPALANIRVDQITSVEVIDNADRFQGLYMQVYPRARPPIPSRGSVVALYSKNGNGIYGALKQDIIDATLDSMQVFAIEKEFYVPDYDKKDDNEVIIPDLRSPVYWRPVVETGLDGKAQLSYFHSDNSGDFVIFIEAISDDGRIGYKEFEYNVEPSN